MANEITVTATLAITRDGVTINETQTKQLTASSASKYGGVTAVATTATAIGFGGMTNVAYILLKNLDASATIDIYLEAACTNKIGSILPGETWGPFRPPAATPVNGARSSAGTVNLQVVAVPN